MLSKNRETPERCCVNVPQCAERAMNSFLMSRIRGDHEFPRDSEVTN